MPNRTDWTRQQLLIAFALYCRIPFRKFRYGDPDIVQVATAIGRSPAALAMKLWNIASLDPEITSTGRRGLSRASVRDRAMWNEMNDNWNSFSVESQQAIETVHLASELIDGTAEDESAYPTGEDIFTSTTTRSGQSFFRAVVLSAYSGRCCITGLSVPSLLVASHIVPWRHDRHNRTNPRNGLLLSVMHDKAFDNGLLTINDDMTVRVSRNHSWSGDQYFVESIVRYDGVPISLPEKFRPCHNFLDYHRKHIFQG